MINNSPLGKADIRKANTANKSTEPFIDRTKLEQWNSDDVYELSFVRSNSRIVIIGEDHSSKTQLAKQIDLIKLLKPSCVLHEHLGAYQILEAGAEKILQAGRKDRDPNLSYVPDRFKELQHEIPFKIKGCDRSPWELHIEKVQYAREHPKIYSLESDPVLGLDIIRKDGKSLYDDPAMNYHNGVHNTFRENGMLASIKLALEEPGLVVAILGQSHVRDMHREQKFKDISYAMAIPAK